MDATPIVTAGQKWEYKFFALPYLTHGDPTKFLNDMGQQGWELVGVIPANITRELYFKRPISPAPAP